jgi:hypothetical protein
MRTSDMYQNGVGSGIMDSSKLSIQAMKQIIICYEFYHHPINYSFELSL